MKWRFAKARPDPDFRYCSNARAPGKPSRLSYGPRDGTQVLASIVRSRALTRRTAQGVAARGCIKIRRGGTAHRPTGMNPHWHPLELLRVVFVVLVLALMIPALTTGARPRTSREWTLVWMVLV